MLKPYGFETDSHSKESRPTREFENPFAIRNIHEMPT